LSPFQKLQILIWDRCYYSNQECCDFFDRIGKSMFKGCMLADQVF
jgi:hypothetical protein